MAILTVQPVPVDGGLEVAAVAAAAGGDEAPTGNGRLLYVRNANASLPRTVTVATPGTVSGLDIADVATPVAAGEVWLLPLARVFANGSTGLAAVSYSDAAADLTVAVLEPGR